MASDAVRHATGGELLVELLGRIGTDTAFGVVSVHNLPLVDAIDRHLRWVPTRGEAGAVGAADGHARARRGVGCAVTSTGTGAGNAAGALIEALTAATPLLHVTGQIDSQYLGQGRGVIHETSDQLGMLRAVSIWATTVGDDPAGDLAEAVRHASGVLAGPSSVEWPIDRQFQPAARLDPPVLPVDERPDPDPVEVERAALMMAESKRPIVWAGGGALGAGPEVDRLLDRLGAGLITSNAGRGVLSESDPRVIGNFASSDVGSAVLTSADLLVSLGTHFRSNETRSYRLALPPAHIQIDLEPTALGRSYPCAVPLAGDVSVVLRQLLERLPGSGPGRSDWQEEIRRVRAECRRVLRGDIGPYEPICDAMNRTLGPDGMKVRDITIPNSAWGNRLLDIAEPHTNIYPRGGGIGQALAMGIGASIGRPDAPTMVLIGDGGLQSQLGELATLAQEQLPVTVVVFDDGGYGVLRNMQDRHLGRRSGVDLFTPSLPDVATAHDLAYWRVESSEQFAPAFAAAVATKAPAMVHVDCTRLGAMPKPFTPPVDIPEPPM